MSGALLSSNVQPLGLGAVVMYIRKHADTVQYGDWHIVLYNGKVGYLYPLIKEDLLKIAKVSLLSKIEGYEY